MSPRARALWVCAWLALVLALGFAVQQRLVVGSDLRLFMPTPETPAQRLLLEEIGEGPGARLLLIALEGATPELLARSSHELAQALAHDPLFRYAGNGEAELEDIPDALLAYRYLLSPTLDRARFDAPFLRDQLEQRAQDMASPAAGMLEEWLPRDPTLETLALAQAWQPTRQPERVHEVWYDAAGGRALLVAQTAAPGFDPDAQRQALDALHAHFERTRADPAIRLVASGPGAFAVAIRDRTQAEAQALGTVAGVAMVLLLLVAYRGWDALVLGALPLLSAGVVGLGTVAWAFGSVHGITLAFGFTLIGVAQDYPMHLFSHRHPGLDALASARALWPTLATGVASTSIAYLAFLVSGVNGLAQLACFTVAGLAVAALTTRYLLPRLMGPGRRDHGDSRMLARLWSLLAALPRPRWLGIAVVAASVAVVAFVPGPFWEHNLATLTPVPPELLQRDAALRVALAAPDVRQMLVLEGRDREDTLERSEALRLELDKLVAADAIEAYDLAARYLPSAATQLRRRERLPDPDALRAALAEASADSPFRAGVFEPFVADVERARGLGPLTPERLSGTPLELSVGALLLERGGRTLALVSLSGVHDSAALASLARATPGLVLLDLKAESEALVARYRERILGSLALAALLLVVVVRAALGNARRTAVVLAPMALTTLGIVAILHGAGVPLSLFHLVALVLAAGLGLDYALFFEHAEDDPREQCRTLHALLVCALSTLMVFALLCFSSIPVLRAIGITVTIGVVSNFVLALLLTRPSAERA